MIQGRNMRDLLKRSDVIQILNEYRQSLLKDLESTPADLAIHHRLAAIQNIEHRVRVLSQGGLRVIQGGLDRNS